MYRHLPLIAMLVLILAACSGPAEKKDELRLPELNSDEGALLDAGRRGKRQLATMDRIARVRAKIPGEERRFDERRLEVVVTVFPLDVDEDREEDIIDTLESTWQCQARSCFLRNVSSGTSSEDVVFAVNYSVQFSGIGSVRDVTAIESDTGEGLPTQVQTCLRRSLARAELASASSTTIEASFNFSFTSPLTHDFPFEPPVSWE